jgi:hypothetical protein
MDQDRYRTQDGHRTSDTDLDLEGSPTSQPTNLDSQVQGRVEARFRTSARHEPGMKLGLSCAGSGIRAHGIRMDAKAQVQEKRMKTEGRQKEVN